MVHFSFSLFPDEIIVETKKKYYYGAGMWNAQDDHDDDVSIELSSRSVCRYSHWLAWVPNGTSR